MAFDTTDLRVQRRKALEECRSMIDKADAEKRVLSAEERQAYDKCNKAAEDFRSQIEHHERANKLEADEIALKAKQEEEAARTAKKPEEKRLAGIASEEYRTAFAKSMFSTDRLTDEEQRALAAGKGTQAGYLYAPDTFVNELIQNVTDATIVRQLARVWPPIGAADSISAPVLVDRMAAAAWTSELGTPSADSTLSFGKRSLTPHPLAKEILVSKVLRKKAAIAEQVVRTELARIAGEAMENAFLTGSGDQQPLGVFTSSALGINTDRDVSTGNTTATPKFDGLKAAKYALKQAYWGGAVWLMHRDIMELIAKLKDGEGRYLLQDSVVNGEPDRMLGFPVRLSEFAPDSDDVTSGALVAILGNWAEGYWIVDSDQIEIQVAEELYIRSNQDWFGMRAGVDGAPVKSEAFVRVKLA